MQWKFYNLADPAEQFRLGELCVQLGQQIAELDYEQGHIRLAQTRVLERADECSGALQMLVDPSIRAQAEEIYTKMFVYGYYETQRKSTMYPCLVTWQGAVYVFYDPLDTSFGYRLYIRGDSVDTSYTENDVLGFRTTKQAESAGLAAFHKRFDSGTEPA